MPHACPDPGIDPNLRLTLMGPETEKNQQGFPFMVLKPTQPMGDIIRYAAAGKSCAFNTQHLPHPVSSEKKTARNKSGSDVSSENSDLTASTTRILGSEHSQSSGAYSLEGLTSSRGL